VYQKTTLSRSEGPTKTPEIEGVLAGGSGVQAAERARYWTVPNPALEAVEASGLTHRVIRHGPVNSLAEAARARGVAPADVVKTLVVRRGADDFLFVLVPGDRAISWPKLRGLLGVSRLSMPDAEVARQVTGYERGTITPLGSVRPWPVIADERLRGREITLGAGEHGVALAVDADEILQALGASVADISDREGA
jgi:Cys-tRNA(Pro)/Cys-tRNA(Cys) deacylase